MNAFTVISILSVVVFGAAPRSVEASTVFIATLDGASARPTPVATGATGFGRVVLSESEDMVTASVSWTGLEGGVALAAHLHFPADTENVAPPILFLSTDPLAGPQLFPVDAQDVQELEAGLWYFNVHNPANPGGHIRGQVVPEPGSAWLGTSALVTVAVLCIGRKRYRLRVR